HYSENLPIRCFRLTQPPIHVVHPLNMPHLGNPHKDQIIPHEQAPRFQSAPFALLHNPYQEDFLQKNAIPAKVTFSSVDKEISMFVP
ncbi:MAG: hypothetical protein ACLFQ6_10675, partial [Candidatus Sumerlaeia bacterium]